MTLTANGKYEMVLYHVAKFSVYLSFAIHYLCTIMFICQTQFWQFLSVHFLMWEILNLDLTFA